MKLCLYHKCANLLDAASVAGSNLKNAGKVFKLKHRDPPPAMASSKNPTSAANQLTYGKKIGDYLILVTETLAIRKTL